MQGCASRNQQACLVLIEGHEPFHDGHGASHICAVATGPHACTGTHSQHGLIVAAPLPLAVCLHLQHRLPTHRARDHQPMQGTRNQSEWVAQSSLEACSPGGVMCGGYRIHFLRPLTTPFHALVLLGSCMLSWGQQQSLVTAYKAAPQVQRVHTSRLNRTVPNPSWQAR